MTSQTVDESSKTYGTWLVIEYAGRNPQSSPGSIWTCECVHCSSRRPIRGVDLRRNKLPICKGCCRRCGRTRSQTIFKGNKKICVECDKQRICGWKGFSQEQIGESIRKWRSKQSIPIDNSPKEFHYVSNPEVFVRNLFKRKLSIHRTAGKIQGHKLNNDKYTIEVTGDFIVSLWHKQNGKCAITNMPMVCESDNIESVSIDRIDSNKGYVHDNIQLVCRWVNLAKSVFLDDQIRDVLSRFKSC